MSYRIQEGLKQVGDVSEVNTLYLLDEKAVIGRLVFSVTLARCVGNGDVTLFTMIRIIGKRVSIVLGTEQKII